jgi:hypothetical protein
VIVCAPTPAFSMSVTQVCTCSRRIVATGQSPHRGSMWLRQWLAFFAAVFGSTRRDRTHRACQSATVSLRSRRCTDSPRSRAVSRSRALATTTALIGSVIDLRLPLGSRTTVRQLPDGSRFGVEATNGG